jgi:hypothetical protein
MLNKTVIGDASWVHHYQPESKRASVETSQFTVNHKDWSLRLRHHSQGVMMVHFQKCDESVNSALYHEVLLKLRDAVHRKHPANWQDGYCFIMTMPDPIQSKQPRRDFKNCGGTWFHFVSMCFSYKVIHTILETQLTDILLSGCKKGKKVKLPLYCT